MTAPDLAVSSADGRYYVHPGKPTGRRRVPSITNITGMKDKGGIAKWGYRKCGEFVRDNLDAINSLKDGTAIVDLVRESPWRSTADSSHVGDVVHDWIDRHIKGEKIPQEEFDKPYVVFRDTQEFLTPKGAANARGMWRSFLALEDRYKIEWLMAEITVWSEKHEYAGTMDWIARIGGALTIGDNKTGNNVYKEVAMQLAAGAFADYAFDGQGNQIAIPKAERFAVAHLRPRYGRLVPVVHLEEAFKSFLGLREVFEWDTTFANEDVLLVAPKIEAALDPEVRK